MSRVIAMATAACLAAGVGHAEPADLWDLLRMDELVGVMAEEGVDYGDYLADQLFDHGGGAAWDARVAGLYDAQDMADEIRPAFTAMFDDVETRGLEDFFSSDLGQRIIRYELDARRTLLDAEAEAAASEAYVELREGDPARHALIGDFIAVNDLIETNVASTLTFTYSFNLGLVDGGMEDMTEDDALSEAWAQEDAMREDTVRWLGAQLSLAFAPLSDEEVDKYVDVSGTEAGQALNAALFQAFEPTFSRIARGLGEAVAQSISGQDI